jgi:hypothetical protein
MKLMTGDPAKDWALARTGTTGDLVMALGRDNRMPVILRDPLSNHAMHQTEWLTANPVSAIGSGDNTGLINWLGSNVAKQRAPYQPKNPILVVFRSLLKGGKKLVWR